MARIYCSWFLKFLCVIVVGHKLFLPLTTAKLHHLSKFSKYTLIRPQFYHGKEKREILTTKNEDGNHPEHLIMSYDDENVNYIVELKLNKYLTTKGYSIKYQENGTFLLKNNGKQNVDLCYYQGKIRGIPDSWASLSTCIEDRLSGTVYNGREKLYFEKAFDENGEHLSNFNFLYKNSDVTDTKRTHPHQNDFFNASSEKNGKRRYKRDYQGNEVTGPYNANRQSRYVELLVVVVNIPYSDTKLSVIEDRVLSIVNTLNSLYSPLNIYLALVNILILNDFSVLQDANDILDAKEVFLRYRKEHLIEQYPNDFTLLLMLSPNVFPDFTYNLTDSGGMCTSSSSGCIMHDVPDDIPITTTALRVAREIGLALGIGYDTDDCICPEQNCIMNQDFKYSTHWSSCSYEALASLLERGIDYCLRNKPEFLFDNPICGNGFVDFGEQCDCGLTDSCNNPCCNATTCRFHTNATCATGKCCDLKTCKLKPAATVCRYAYYECDLPEYCTGKSEYCPTDVFKIDTLPCAGGESYCYKGSCRTRSDQCKILWEKTGTSSGEKCYSLNTEGSIRGSCGYNKLNMSYSRCRRKDILCGMLHCKSPDTDLKIGKFFTAETEECYTAMIDFGVDTIDLGMVPDGSKCGESMMCVNQTCMAIADLRPAAKICSRNCNGNGVCNNFGHCHCKYGFAPPFCNIHGYGGSEDSGPTIDLHGAKISNKPFKTLFSAGKMLYESTKIIQVHAVL